MDKRYVTRVQATLCQHFVHVKHRGARRCLRTSRGCWKKQKRKNMLTWTECFRLSTAITLTANGRPRKGITSGLSLSRNVFVPNGGSMDKRYVTRVQATLCQHFVHVKHRGRRNLIDLHYRKARARLNLPRLRGKCVISSGDVNKSSSDVTFTFDGCWRRHV
jgi:hypothetical protein